MRTSLLFLPGSKIWGAILGIPGLILGYLVVYQNYEIPGFTIHLRNQATLFKPADENLTNELALALTITGLVLIAFSRLKREDELTAKIRLNALYWAILINYLLYIVLSVLFMIAEVTDFKPIGNLLDSLNYVAISFLIPLATFIGRLYYLLYRNKNSFSIKPVRFLAYKPYNLLGKWTSAILAVIVIAGLAFNLNGVLLSFFWALPLSLLLWVYSREKNEDEYINTVRLEAMQVAVYANYAILLLSNFFFYGLDFLMIQVINLITIPVIFIVWFKYRVYVSSKQPEINNI